MLAMSYFIGLLEQRVEHSNRESAHMELLHMLASRKRLNVVVPFSVPYSYTRLNHLQVSATTDSVRCL